MMRLALGVKGDIRVAFRNLRRRPGFALLSIGTLGVCLAVCSALFTIFSAAFLRPLATPSEDRVVFIAETSREKPGEIRGFSYPNFLDWQRKSQSFSSLGIVTNHTATLPRPDGAIELRGALVSGGFFETLGWRAQLGRLLGPQDDVVGGTDGSLAVVLTDTAFRKWFGSDPQVLGRRIVLDGETATVVGVTPPGVLPLETEPIDYWAAIAANGDPGKPGTANASRGLRTYVGAIGRLRDGVTIARARTELTGIARSLEQEYPRQNEGAGAFLVPLREYLFGDSRSGLLIALASSILVLVIAAINVASLGLVRALERGREMAVKAALGASRFDVVRGHLAESVLVALGGTALGLSLSKAFLTTLVAAAPEDLPRLAHLDLDGGVFLFGAALMMLVALIAGVAPALFASRPQHVVAFDRGRSLSSSVTHRPMSALVVGQAALATVLVAGAALLARSVQELQRVDTGFRPENVLTATLNLSAERYADSLERPERVNAFIEEARRRIGALPGVTAVSAAQVAPFAPVDNSTTVVPDGMTFAEGTEPTAGLRFTAPGYFNVIGTRVLSGRDFSRDDAPGQRPVAIVNDAFVRDILKGRPAIGTKIQMGWAGDAPKEIVGVVSNIRHAGLRDSLRPEMYVPLSQWRVRSLTFVARSSTSASSIGPSLRREIAAMDSSIAVTSLRSLEDTVTASSSRERFTRLLSSSLAGIALLLAAIGIFGVLSSVVAQRIPEMGVRLALGSTRASVASLVLARGLRLTGTGTGIGLVAAALGQRLLGSLTFGLSAFDPWAFGMASAALLAVSGGAALLPALRAARVDPAVSLRTH